MNKILMKKCFLNVNLHFLESSIKIIQNISRCRDAHCRSQNMLEAQQNMDRTLHQDRKLQQAMQELGGSTEWSLPPQWLWICLLLLLQMLRVLMYRSLSILYVSMCCSIYIIQIKAAEY
ncbi:Hypothetical predicted protein [Olea europaea subsp. europaea]|uniref:Uncharacterized protein n=2 Tax=Olea europaea subsp. europaea TaxID=158383 RepID=A0A8S0VIB5_OLEEU|nr:Hypothetical predicted protein [Olea europaea subsp. europaea]